MCEPEVISAVADLASLGHEHGEAIWSKIQWWVSMSFALILTAHFAPQRMNLFVSLLLGVIYVVFTLMVLASMGADGQIGGSTWVDAKELAELNSCGSLAVLRPPDVPLLSFASYLLVFIIILPLSTLGYLAYTCKEQSKNRTSP